MPAASDETLSLTVFVNISPPSGSSNVVEITRRTGCNGR
jgi:hypothetical protein